MVTIQRTIDVSIPTSAPDAEPEPDVFARFGLTPFPSLDDLKKEAAEKTARRLAEGREPFEEAHKMLNGRKLFGNVDPVKFQRELRDEWPD